MKPKKVRPTIELTCAYTGEKFLKDRREYDRQIRRGHTIFYKDKEAAKKGIAIKQEARRAKEEDRECKHCGKVFRIIPKRRSSHFCCRKCQGLYHWERMRGDESKIESFKEKARASSLLAWEKVRVRHDADGGEGPYIPRKKQVKTAQCEFCGKLFQHPALKSRKTCSDSCSKELTRKKAQENPNCGGETNFKRFVYQNILFDSSWEVEIAKWMDEHNVKWIRSRKMLFRWTDSLGNKRRYYPDFYLPDFNVYLDPKNKYLMEKDREKIEAAQRENNIVVIWGLRESILSYLESLFS